MKLETFFREKNLPPVEWELEDENGMVHIIGNDVVIDFLMKNPEHGEKVKPTLMKIDFLNGNVNDFLKHIAGYIINL